jgi:hypothetical protein
MSETRTKIDSLLADIGEIKSKVTKIEEREALQEQTQHTPAAPQAQEVKSANEPPHHILRSWEKKCVNCGEPNPNYKKPDLFCTDCGNPVGNAPDSFQAPEEGEAEVPGGPDACWNCGGKKVRVQKS